MVSYISIHDPGSKKDLPDKHTECLCICHMHQERSHDKAKTLTIANLGIVETEALQNASQHLLALAIGITEHFHIGKTAANILPNHAFVRAGLAAESLILNQQGLVSRAGQARPHNAPQWWWHAASNLVCGQGGKTLGGLGIIGHQGSPELEFGHGRGGDLGISK